MPDLEQRRAAEAWRAATDAASHEWKKEYENLAKAAPALIMSNGLMQTLAFFQGKGKKHHLALNKQILDWLSQRFEWVGRSQVSGDKSEFAKVMKALHGSEPMNYRLATEEAMALLKWIRQFAAAVNDV